MKDKELQEKLYKASQQWTKVDKKDWPHPPGLCRKAWIATNLTNDKVTLWIAYSHRFTVLGVCFVAEIFPGQFSSFWEFLLCCFGMSTVSEDKVLEGF